MKRYFGVIIVLVMVVVAIVWSTRRWNENKAEAARDQNALRIRGDYYERVAWLRNVPDQKAYNDEVGTFLRWYFKEINEHFNKCPTCNRNFDDYLVELETKSKKNPEKAYSEFESPSKDKSGDRKAVYEYTRKVFDQLRTNYSVFWTGTQQGIRLDILSASTTRVGGDDKIHMPLVIWGLPREEHVDDRGTRRVTANGSIKFNWRLLDEKNKLVAEIPGEGMDSRVDWPDRYVKFFPPSIVLGHWDIDKVPANAKKAEITMTISARSPTGGDINSTYTWNLDVPAEWKLGAGETWKGAQESIRPEEEIDPAKAKKTN